MSITLTPADQSMLNVLQDVLVDHYPELIEADLKIEVLMASAPEGKPAVKLHGNPALAVIKIVGPDERCSGGPDVRIKVDLGRWASLGPKRREALFAHELFHVVLSRDEDGELLTDDYDRPKVKLKPDDWAITGFKAIYDLYGEDSVEWSSYVAMRETLGQGTFDFMGKDGERKNGASDPADAAALAGVGSTGAAAGR